jgi:hypothetical protein
LDQKHHQEGDDSGAGIDHELRSVREAEQRIANCPDHDNGEGLQLVVSGCDAPELFELVEGGLDAIALFVEIAVIKDAEPCGSVWVG